VNNRMHVLAALTMLLLAAEAVPAQAQEPAPPAGIPVTSPENRIELRLPAAYWDAQTGAQIAAGTPGGCAPTRVSPDLLFVIRHLDALAEIWIIRSEEPFLMRDKNDLEAVVNAFTGAIRDRLGETMSDVESEYEERDGMIIHRFAFTAPPQGGGGCVPAQPAAEPQKLRFMLVHYFLRPEGEDAIFFRASCRATAETFEALEGEINFILSSLRFTGPVAENFFAPDAPQEKLLTADKAAKAVRRPSGVQGWMLAIGMMVIIWMLLRRRKKPEV